MIEILQKCTILGFMPCTVKETHEEMIRTCIEIKSEKEGYYGSETKYIFLSDSEDKRNLLKRAVDDKSLDVYAKIALNIVNGTSKIVDIIIK